MSGCPAHPEAPTPGPPEQRLGTGPIGAGHWRRRRRPRRRSQPSLPPGARPHIVDDHGLVGDDVVGLHGPAEPAQPSRRAAGGPAGSRARGRTRTDATPDAAPHPSPSALPTRARPRGQSQLPTGLIDGGRRGGWLGRGGASGSRPANRGCPEGPPGVAKVGCAASVK